MKFRYDIKNIDIWSMSEIVKNIDIWCMSEIDGFLINYPEITKSLNLRSLLDIAKDIIPSLNNNQSDLSQYML